MDTIKMLLAATTALLLGALAWNWQQQNTAAKDAPKAELARVKLQLAEIAREEQNLAAEKRLRDIGMIDSPDTSKASPSEVEEKEAQLRAIEEQNKRLQEELSLKEKEKELAEKEGGLIAQRDLEKSDKELRRARQISEALLMAKVTEYVEDPATGSFVTIQLLMPDNVSVDTILSVRRKSGIAGNIKIREIVGGDAIADVLPGIGPFAPEAGDELILAPAF
jgi:hypothetical protein